MARIERSALLPFSAQQVYELINDISAYPRFMEGCAGAEVLKQSEHEIEARLDLIKAGKQYSFTTRNRLEPPNSVVMELIDGPFSDFNGRWDIETLSDDACKVTLALNFTMKSKMLGMAAKVMFNPIADDLVGAVVKRAEQLYQ